MQWTKGKHFIPLFGIILLSVIFRFVLLDRIPPAISGDELHYATTAKFIWLTGHDSTGTWNPLSVFLFRYPPNEQQAELPYFLHLPFSGPFPFSLFLAKVPFAVLSVGIVILLYGIARKLFGRTGGIVTGLVAAVNPWLVVMGRTGYESTAATFFYLLGTWILLSANSWRVLWSLIPFLLAFYSYIGTKLIFVPFVILSVILTYTKQKHNALKPYLTLMLLCIVITAGYLVLLKTSPTGSRISEILLPSSPAVAAQVNEIRKTSIQSPILPMIVNKYTAYFQIIVSKLFRIFSPTYLFLEGDQFFLPVRQSFFYYVDFLFILWGALAIFANNRKRLFILTGFLLVGTLPHLLHTTMGDFSGHLALMFPFMILLIAAGVTDCVDHIKGRIRPFALGILGIIYILNVANFATIYFLQYPLVGAGDFPLRVLSRYVTLARQTQTPVTVYSTRKADLLTKYLFYGNAITRTTLPDITHLATNQPFTFNGIQFTDCDEGIKASRSLGITISDTTCTMHIDEPRVSIATLRDGGKVYAIYNDTVCNTYSLNTYASGIRISDLALERFSPKQYCETFITR